MRNTFILAIFAGIVATSGANAQETAPVTSDVTTETTVENPLIDQFSAICLASTDGVVILSDAAMAACAENVAPTILADGSRFSNRGIGSEINTLARNMAMFN